MALHVGELYNKLGGSQSWRLTPATMGQTLTGGRWIAAQHLQMVGAYLAHKFVKGNARVIISFPPRHGKSELISVHTPTWVFDWNPFARVMLASYGADLATGFGRRVREQIAEHPDVLNVRLKKDSQQVDRFETTAGGAMYSVGVGGALTGRGADLLLIDDYLKNAKDAISETIRNDIYDWFVSTALTRLEPGGSCFIIATRWHIDDLTGRLKTMHGDEWEEICLPALAMDDDPLGRKPGEALWPERYNESKLESIKNSLGTYFFQALYQQHPIPRTTGLNFVNRIVKITSIPFGRKLRLVRAWDFAATPEDGDWTVGVLLGEDAEFGITYILDVRRARLGPFDVEKLVRRTAEHDGTAVRIVLEQEPGGSGKAYALDMIKKLKGFNAGVTAIGRTGPKHLRAQPFYAACEAGLVHMMEASWNKDYLDELQVFPDGTHDDQVDATSAAYNTLHGKSYRGVTWGRSGSIYTPNYMPQNEGTEKLITGPTWR